MQTARAAVLRQTKTPMTIETVQVGPLAPGDVLVRVRAASLCHTDLEAIEGALSVQLPAVLGHEAAGEIVDVGTDVTELGIGDRVVLSWNPHCGSCFYCDRAQPILCRQFLANGPKGFHFDGRPRLTCEAVPVHQLMYLGGFAEYCVVPAQSAVRVPDSPALDCEAAVNATVGGSSLSTIVSVPCCVPLSLPLVTLAMSTVTASSGSSRRSLTAVRTMLPEGLPAAMTSEAAEV